MKQIAVYPNASKPRSGEIIGRIVKYFAGREVRVIMSEESALRYGVVEKGLPCVEKIHADVALSIGGDGTLLGVCRRYIGREVPVCGINLGTLGFLADIEPRELELRLEQILRGEYRLERRLMLRAVGRRGRILGEAINEVVIKSSVGRLVRLRLGINGEELMKFGADGIIIASPTGSTAYSLSAGGPLVNPTIRALLVTPICAHTFQMRPLIVREEDEVRVGTDDTQELVATLDGQMNVRLERGEEIIIRKSTDAVQIIRFADKNYYRVLISKILT